MSVQRVFRSKNFKIGLPFSNAAHYSNPEVDRLLEAASVETNEAKRQPFIQFQQIVHDDIPSIEFGANPSITVVSKKIGEYGPTGGGLKGNFASLYILH